MGLFRRAKTLNELALETAGLVERVAPTLEGTRVEASPRAIACVQQRGGRLYVWTDRAGLSRTRTSPPGGSIDFVRIPAEGFELFQDPALGSPEFWRTNTSPCFVA